MTALYSFCCHRIKWMTFYSESYGSLTALYSFCCHRIKWMTFYTRACSFHIFSSTFLTLSFSMFFICYFSTGIQVLQGTWASCLLARLWLLFGHVSFLFAGTVLFAWLFYLLVVHSFIYFGWFVWNNWYFIVDHMLPTADIS